MLTNLVSLSSKLAIYPPKYIHLIMLISYTIFWFLKDLPVAFVKYPWQPGQVISPETIGFPDWLLYWLVHRFNNSSQTPFTWICHWSAPGQTAYKTFTSTWLTQKSPNKWVKWNHCNRINVLLCQWLKTMNVWTRKAPGDFFFFF